MTVYFDWNDGHKCVIQFKHTMDKTDIFRKSSHKDSHLIVTSEFKSIVFNQIGLERFLAAN